MESDEQRKSYIEEELKERFFKLQEQFDAIERAIDSLSATVQKKFEEEREGIKQDAKREYSEDLKKLISSDTDYRNNKLLQKMDEFLLNMLPKKRNKLYVWGAIFVIFILQIITFGISS
jgi:hypothetical protein